MQPKGLPSLAILCWEESWVRQGATLRLKHVRRKKIRRLINFVFQDISKRTSKVYRHPPSSCCNFFFAGFGKFNYKVDKFKAVCKYQGDRCWIKLTSWPPCNWNFNFFQPNSLLNKSLLRPQLLTKQTQGCRIRAQSLWHAKLFTPWKVPSGEDIYSHAWVHPVFYIHSHKLFWTNNSVNMDFQPLWSLGCVH